MMSPLQRADARLLSMAVVAAALLAPTLLAVFVAVPRWRTLADHRRQYGRLDDAAVAARTTAPRLAVEEQVRAEKAARERLLAEWDRLFLRVQTLQKDSSLADLLLTTQEGRIDFKVSLFDARARLGRAAQEKKIALPADLGVPETIAADEDTEKRLWQLVSTVMLLEQCIGAGIPAVERVEPMAPRSIPLPHGEYNRLLLYPVRVRFACAYPQWRALLEAIRGGGTFFTLDAVHLERGAFTEPLPLKVDAVLSAVVFKRENKTETENPDATAPGDTNPPWPVVGWPGN